MILTFGGANQFGGISPAIDPVNLPASGAQIALNCRLQSGGSVEPIRAPIQVYPITGTLPGLSGTVRSIYRFKRAQLSETEWWFAMTGDTDFVIGQIAGDETERTFYTSDEHPPRYTYSPLAEAGAGPYPSNYRLLGVPGPTTAPTRYVTGQPDAGTIPELRFYAYTFVTSDGQESAPSPATGGIEWSAGQIIHIEDIEPFPAGNYDFASGKVRIYRSASGSTRAGFFLAAELSVSALASASPPRSWADPNGPASEEVPTEGWLPPDPDLRGLVSLPNGILAAFKGRDVWFTPAYAPYAWPVRYRQTVDLPIVGLGAFGNSLAVLTIGEPHIISGADPELMSQQKLAMPLACVAKRSIQTVGNAVLYACPEGIASISDAGVSIITHGVFTKREWDTYAPTTMIGASYDGLYILFYDSPSRGQGGLVFDPDNRAVTETDLFATAAFGDTVNNALYLAIDQRIQKFDAGSPLPMHWKSGKRLIPKPGSFGWAQVLADTYPVQFNVWADGVKMPEFAVQSDRAFRLPVLHGRVWEASVAGAGRTWAAYLAQASSELAGV